MKINGCKLFGKKEHDKYPHKIRIKEEHEELLAALMIKENRDISNEVERALEIHFKQFSAEKRDEAMEEVERRRGEEQGV